MLKTKDGFKIVEVNSTPGFEGLENCTKKNIAKSIMEFAKSMGKVKKKKVKVYIKELPIEQPLSQQLSV
jgi:RimK-like ATP-grasp domain